LIIFPEFFIFRNFSPNFSKKKKRRAKCRKNSPVQAKSPMKLTAPKDASGALYFLPGQYLFKRVDENGCEITKALSSGQIGRAFREFETDTGWLESRILLRYRESAQGNAFVSVEPAGIKSIFVEDDDQKVRELKLPLPALVLLGMGRNYHLWAAAQAKRTIAADMPLSVAPLPNIGAGAAAGVCFGQNEVPEARPENIDRVWNLIFNAPFNRDQSNGKCRLYPEDVRKLLFELAAAGNKKTFPSRELIGLNLTLAEAWDRIAERIARRFF
jgi:hypothetical protein